MCELVREQPNLMAKVVVNILWISELLLWELRDGRKPPLYSLSPICCFCKGSCHSNRNKTRICRTQVVGLGLEYRKIPPLTTMGGHFKPSMGTGVWHLKLACWVSVALQVHDMVPCQYGRGVIQFLPFSLYFDGWGPTWHWQPFLFVPCSSVPKGRQAELSSSFSWPDSGREG